MGWLRIIAGELRGRRIAVPPGTGVRPTSERAREALFSILGGRVPGVRLLDAYAGSGALGFEALSRGAREVVFVEAERRVAEALGQTAGRLGVAARTVVQCGPVVALLQRGTVRGPFDVVLADPPYAAEGERRLFLEAAAGLLGPDGLLVLERDVGAPVVSCGGLCHVRTASYGRSRLDFYRGGDGFLAGAGPG